MKIQTENIITANILKTNVKDNFIHAHFQIAVSVKKFAGSVPKILSVLFQT